MNKFKMVLVVFVMIVALFPQSAGAQGPEPPEATTCLADWGDLPWYYPTRWYQGGPHHTGDGELRLGMEWDDEDDGQPSWWAVGDDNAGYPDDEDGIQRWPGELWKPGNTVHVTATIFISPTAVISGGFVTGWVDWDGDWALEEPERATKPVVKGENVISLTIPVSYTTGTALYARWRVYPEMPEEFLPTGQIVGGEVEDYRWTFKPNVVVISSTTIHSSRAVVTLVVLVGVGFAWALYRRRRAF